MSKLEAKIKKLKQDYETNVLNQYALTYEESQIAEQDNEVIKVLQEHKEYLDSIDDGVNALSQKAYSYRYNTLSLNLSGLSFPIATAASYAETEKTNVLTASKRAFDEVSGQFKRSKGDYESYILYATNYLSSAKRYYKNSINMRGKDEEQYERAMKSYSQYKSKTQEYYDYASKKYNDLIDLINNQGLKKSLVSIQSDSLDDEFNSEQPVKTEEMKIEAEVLKKYFPFLSQSLSADEYVFEGTVDEEGLPLNGTITGYSTWDNSEVEKFEINSVCNENGEKVSSNITLSSGDRLLEYQVEYTKGKISSDEKNIYSNAETYYYESVTTKGNLFYEKKEFYDENDEILGYSYENIHIREDGFTYKFQNGCDVQFNNSSDDKKIYINISTPNTEYTIDGVGTLIIKDDDGDMMKKVKFPVCTEEFYTSTTYNANDEEIPNNEMLRSSSGDDNTSGDRVTILQNLYAINIDTIDEFVHLKPEDMLHMTDFDAKEF